MINKKFWGLLAIFITTVYLPVFALSNESKTMLERLRIKAQGASTTLVIQAEQISESVLSAPEDIFQIIATNNSKVKTSLESHLKLYPDSIKLKSDNGTTPLHDAAQYCAPEIVSLLLSHGADVNAKTPSGLTPFALASNANAKILKAAGAKPNRPENSRSGKINYSDNNKSVNGSSSNRSRLSNGDYTIYTGPRGGKYHRSASGKKVYHKR